MDNKLIVSNNNSPQEMFLKSLKLSLISILLGIVVTFAGKASINNLNYFSKDYEVILAKSVYVFGILMIVLSFFYPFAIKAIAKKQTINVYEDHIEGKAFNIVANTQTLVDFYETYDKISSVSTIENNVIINLLSGNSIKCIAFNSNQIAGAIRERIQ